MPRNTLSALGAALAEVREAHGLSQEEVADRVERVDLDDDDRRHQELSQLRSGSDLDAIERGDEDPSFLTLVLIARAIDTPLSEVFIAFDRLRGASG